MSQDRIIIFVDNAAQEPEVTVVRKPKKEPSLWDLEGAAVPPVEGETSGWGWNVATKRRKPPTLRGTRLADITVDTGSRVTSRAPTNDWQGSTGPKLPD